MRSKVNLGYPKWPTAAIKKFKVAYWSKMARNAIESEFRTSKMADGSHFVKKIPKKISCVSIWNGQKCNRKWISDIQNERRRPFCNIDIKWPEMWSTAVIFWNGRKCHRKWALDIQNGRRQPFCKKKLWYWSEMVRSDFWTSKMATGDH